MKGQINITRLCHYHHSDDRRLQELRDVSATPAPTTTPPTCTLPDVITQSPTADEWFPVQHLLRVRDP